MADEANKILETLSRGSWDEADNKDPLEGLLDGLFGNRLTATAQMAARVAADAASESRASTLPAPALPSCMSRVGELETSDPLFGVSIDVEAALNDTGGASLKEPQPMLPLSSSAPHLEAAWRHQQQEEGHHLTPSDDGTLVTLSETGGSPSSCTSPFASLESLEDSSGAHRRLARMLGALQALRPLEVERLFSPWQREWLLCQEDLCPHGALAAMLEVQARNGPEPSSTGNSSVHEDEPQREPPVTPPLPAHENWLVTRQQEATPPQTPGIAQTPLWPSQGKAEISDPTAHKEIEITSDTGKLSDRATDATDISDPPTEKEAPDPAEEPRPEEQLSKQSSQERSRESSRSDEMPAPASPPVGNSVSSVMAPPSARLVVPTRSPRGPQTFITGAPSTAAASASTSTAALTPTTPLALQVLAPSTGPTRASSTGRIGRPTQPFESGDCTPTTRLPNGWTADSRQAMPLQLQTSASMMAQSTTPQRRWMAMASGEVRTQQPARPKEFAFGAHVHVQKDAGIDPRLEAMRLATKQDAGIDPRLEAMRLATKQDAGIDPRLEAMRLASKQAAARREEAARHMLGQGSLRAPVGAEMSRPSSMPAGSSRTHSMPTAPALARALSPRALHAVSGGAPGGVSGASVGVVATAGHIRVTR